MSLDPTTIVELGELLTDVQAGLVDEVQRRVHAAGYSDVRPSHDCVFRFLGPDGTRLKTIADQAGMTPQSVGEHVDELERLGYIERVADPADRRAKLIRPTARGVAFMGAGLEAVAEIEEEWSAALGPRAMTQFRKALKEIRAVQLRTATTGT